MTREQRIDHLVSDEGFTRSEAEMIVDETVAAGFIAVDSAHCCTARSQVARVKAEIAHARENWTHTDPAYGDPHLAVRVDRLLVALNDEASDGRQPHDPNCWRPSARDCEAPSCPCRCHATAHDSAIEREATA